MEAFEGQFFTLVSVVPAVIFFSLDSWPSLLEPREANSAPVSAEMSDDTFVLFYCGTGAVSLPSF